MDFISASSFTGFSGLSRLFSRLMLAAALGLLVACASQPTQPQAPTAVAKLAGIEVPALPTSLDAALTALPSSGNRRLAYIFDWAEQSLTSQRINYASSLLQLLDPAQLQPAARLRWVTLMAGVKLAQKDPTAAMALLDSQALGMAQLTRQAPPQTRGAIQLLRAQAQLQQGDLMGSLTLRVNTDSLLSPDDRSHNEQAIWSLLMQLPRQQLQSAQTTAQGDLLGWLKLAAIYRDPSAAITQQALRIDAWLTQWPQHPASQNPPDAIRVLQQATRFRPRKVAILLPQSGPLAKPAKAIRDGLMTAYYRALSDHQTPPELVFLNSDAADIGQLYQQAVRAGAQMVLGPLSKSQVAALAAIGNFSIPVITFNYSADNNAILAPNFYEYGLAPEDQAEQIAAVAWREGKRRAGVLYSESAWGQRVAQAFSAEWQKLGGQVVADMAFNDNVSKVVPELLQIKASHERERRVRRYTRMRIEFQERPRQDIDFLLLAATPAQGRQIKPLLNFHFAARLPVYALSYIYSGNDQPIKNKDLNGIRFLDIPWILDANTPLQKRVHALWPDKHGLYQSLFAMGLDAYRLIDHLPLLMASPDMRLPGETGVLSLRGNQRIRRFLDWGLFKNGHAVLAPKTTRITAPQPHAQ